MPDRLRAAFSPVRLGGYLANDLVSYLKNKKLPSNSPNLYR